MKKTFAVIPVSRFTDAKTRLSPTLSQKERENLLKSMLTDVISVLKKTVTEVIVISTDDDVLEYVKDLGVVPLLEEGPTDLNGALMQAVEWCSSRSDRIIVVPSDIPLIRVENVKQIIGLGENVDMVIAPAKGGGTNAILFPVEGMTMKFGDYSFLNI